MRKRKLALVMSGGGMRCVYGVGVLAALVEEYRLTEPDIIVAASGSVANAAYYLSGQYTNVIAVWLAVLSGKKFIAYGRRTLMDIDYLVDEVSKKQYPFNFKKLSGTKTKFYLATTRIKDGKTFFMKLPHTKKLYESIRAAKAAPLLYGKQVCIGRNCYIDGDFGSNTDDLIRKAIELGATDVIVVENNPGERRSRVKKLMLETLYYQNKLAHRDGIVTAVVRELAGTKPLVLPKNIRAVELSPKKPLALLERTKARLRKGFQQGYDDAVDSKELRALLS